MALYEIPNVIREVERIHLGLKAVMPGVRDWLSAEWSKAPAGPNEGFDPAGSPTVADTTEEHDFLAHLKSSGVYRVEDLLEEIVEMATIRRDQP